MDDIRTELIAIYNSDRYNYHNNVAFQALVDRCTEMRREELPDFLTNTKSITYNNLNGLTQKTPGRSARFFNAIKINVLQVIKRLNCKMTGKKFPIFFGGVL